MSTKERIGPHQTKNGYGAGLKRTEKYLARVEALHPFTHHAKVIHSLVSGGRITVIPPRLFIAKKIGYHSLGRP